MSHNNKNNHHNFSLPNIFLVALIFFIPTLEHITGFAYNNPYLFRVFPRHENYIIGALFFWIEHVSNEHLAMNIIMTSVFIFLVALISQHFKMLIITLLFGSGISFWLLGQDKLQVVGMSCFTLALSGYILIKVILETLINLRYFFSNLGTSLWNMIILGICANVWLNYLPSLVTSFGFLGHNGGVSYEAHIIGFGFGLLVGFIGYLTSR